MSTSNRNEHVYSVAKKSTMVEAILTCNWILGLEFYGMSEKKRGFVTFGIGYRIYCVVANILLLVAIFGFRFLDWYFKESLKGYDYNDLKWIKNYLYIMKIVIGITGAFSIFYNLCFKIWYQIKVRNLMIEEENGLPMIQTYPQTYYPEVYPQGNPQIYPQGNPQMYLQGNPQMYPQSYPQKYPQNY